MPIQIGPSKFFFLSTQSQTRVTGNILHCLKEGTQLDWLIDPDQRSVLVYPPGQQPKLLEEKETILSVPAFMPELQLTVGDLFECLKLETEVNQSFAGYWR